MALADQMAELTETRRTEAIKNALNIYQLGYPADFGR